MYNWGQEQRIFIPKPIRYKISAVTREKRKRSVEIYENSPYRHGSGDNLQELHGHTL